MMARLRVLYFASLRDAAGVESEMKHGFALPVDRLRVAVNGAFAHWDGEADEDAEVAFIPPVSGG